MAESGHGPKPSGETAPNRDNGWFIRRLLKLVLVVPLVIVAALLGLFGLVVFVNGVTGGTYETPGLAFIIIGVIVGAVAALFGALAWVIASQRWRPRIWLTIAVGSFVILILPYIVLVIGALRGGESLWWALSHNLDIYREPVIFGPVDTVLTIVLILLLIGSVSMYVVTSRRDRVENLVVLARRPPTLALAALLLSVTAVAVATAIVVTGGNQKEVAPPPSQDDQRTSAPPTVAVSGGESAGDPEIPSLSDAQREQIVEIALRDPHVRELASGYTLQPGQVAVWHEGGRGLNLVGGVVTLAFPEPITIDGRWMTFERESGQENSKYDTMLYRAEYSHVTELLVQVSLPNQQVVGIEPNPPTNARLAGPIESLREHVQLSLLRFINPLVITVGMFAVLVLLTVVTVALIIADKRHLQGWFVVATSAVLAFLLAFLQTGGTIDQYTGYLLQLAFGLLAVGSAALYLIGGSRSATRA